MSNCCNQDVQYLEDQELFQRQTAHIYNDKGG